MSERPTRKSKDKFDGSRRNESYDEEVTAEVRSEEQHRKAYIGGTWPPPIFIAIFAMMFLILGLAWYFIMFAGFRLMS